MSDSDDRLSATSQVGNWRRRRLIAAPKAATVRDPHGYRIIHTLRGSGPVKIETAAEASRTPEEHTPAQPSIVQVEAAKLRLVTDRRLGKKSPEWLQRVAKGLPPQSVKAAG